MDDIESYLFIKFIAPGSTIMSEPPQIVNMSPLQVIAIAEYLRVTANATILEQRQMSQVQVPKPEAVEKILKP